ncbi:MAG: hypothetical protein ACR2NX_05445 [Chthoniobacterales bacterium]
MENDHFHQALQELNVLYAKTKGYILRAEELDPSCRSNIAVFKEQRDGLDHVMRALSEHLERRDAADENYIVQQIEDAKGHLFRAAYDALDGMGVSYKVRLNKAMEGVSNEAISAVYREYYDVIPEIEKVETRIVEHRKHKDQRRTTLDELEAYCSSIETIDGHYKEVFKRIPLFQDWHKREARKTRYRLILIPVAIAFLGALFFVVLEVVKERYFRDPAAVNNMTSPPPSPSP